MTNVREASRHCEAIKYAYRQSKDGFVLSFVLHPSDVPADVAAAPIGTRYVLALVQLGDNEKPIIPQRKEATKPSQSVARPRTDGAKVKERKRFDELSPAQQAGIWCNEPAFWKFLEEKVPTKWSSFSAKELSQSNTAAAIVRDLCNVKSRSDLTANNIQWDSLVNAYRAWMREPEIVI